jgi:hypothetical protein
MGRLNNFYRVGYVNVRCLIDGEVQLKHTRNEVI